MHNLSEKELKGLNPQKDNNNGPNNSEIEKVRRVRKQIKKEDVFTKRKYKKKNKQIHIHNICVALKNGSVLKIERIETQAVDESKSISKKNVNEFN
jgi:hypothetical protein